MKNDLNLWEDFKAGKENALLNIYSHNVDFLFSYGKKFTQDEGLILDCIQDLFYNLIKTRKNLGKTDHIRFYLITAFRRKLIREIQRSRNLSLENQKVEITPNVSFSVEEEYILEEEKSQRTLMILKGLKELNKRQREVLYYKFTLGLNYSQICEIMAMTNESSRQLVSRSIKKLKKYLAGNNIFFFFFVKKRPNI